MVSIYSKVSRAHMKELAEIIWWNQIHKGMITHVRKASMHAIGLDSKQIEPHSLLVISVFIAQHSEIYFSFSF